MRRPFDRILATSKRRRFAAVALALVTALSVPLGALVSPGGLFSDPLATEAGPAAPKGPLAGLYEGVEELPLNDLRLARQLLFEAAGAQGLDVAPLELPVPSAVDPLHHALREWLYVQHGPAGDAFLDDALAQADRVPVGARAPLALVVLAHAQATQLQRDALQGLSPADQARLAALATNHEALAQVLDAPPAWLVEAGHRVELARSVQAAALLLDAAHVAYPQLHELSEDLGGLTPGELVGPAEGSAVADALEPLQRPDPPRGLDLLGDVLAQLLGRRVDPAPSIPITQQLSAIDQGLGSGSIGPRAPAIPGPPGTSVLPENLDKELGRIFAAARVSVDILATQGPEALATAHLLRAQSMQAALPTLQAYAHLFENTDTDTRLLTSPDLAGGAALVRASQVPAPGANVGELVAYGLGRSAPAAFPASPEGDLVPALAALYDVLGEWPAAGWQADYERAFASLSVSQQRAIATLVRGLTEAILLGNQGMANVPRGDLQAAFNVRDDIARFFGGEVLAADELGPVLDALATVGQLDAEKFAQALLVESAAVQTALSLFGGVGFQASSHEDPNCPSDVELADCDNGLYFVDPLGFVVIGGPGPSHHEHITAFEDGDGEDTVPLLVVDLGGDDTYIGTVGAGIGFLFAPAGIALDLGGRDQLRAFNFAQGAGLVGAGLFVQAGGDTTYNIGGAGQGMAAFGGAGALVELGGNDTYRGGGFTLGSGFPGVTGGGVFVDTDGDDEYQTGRGAGNSLGGFFLDTAGKDVYRVTAEPRGIILSDPIDSDYVGQGLLNVRRDNALWIDGATALDPGFGLDVELSSLDHDSDLWPTLVELITTSNANDPESTPLTAIEDNLAALGDDDEDGAFNLLEEAAGSNANNASQAPVSLPSELPLVPEQLAELYRELRGEHTEAPPPDGLILDVRMPFAGRMASELACIKSGSDDSPIPEQRMVCVETEGPDDDDLQHTTGTLSFPGSSASFSRTELSSEGELGLVALGDVTASNFSLPYLVSIDLAGNDTYFEGAGGAVLFETSTRNTQFNNQLRRDDVGVLPLTHLDLSGNDTYLGDVAAQGAAGGLLVDLRGDDRYEAGELNHGAAGGVLLDDGGDDVYVAGHRSQASAAEFSSFGWPTDVQEGLTTTIDGGTPLAVALSVAGVHQATKARTLQPSLLFDTRGNDTYRAGDESQAFAAVSAALYHDTTRPYTNGTILWAQLFDGDGDDEYHGKAFVQAVAGPGGLAGLVDRAGNDTYNATSLLSQAAVDARAYANEDVMLAGLAMLTDLGGSDVYLARTITGDLVDRSASRQDDVSEERIPLRPPETTQQVADTRLFLEAVHVDIEGSERDSDGDGWPDALETGLGTRPGDPNDRPTASSPETLANGMLLNLPAAGLAIGDDTPTLYTHDYILTIDLGGENLYANNAGGPILDELATLESSVRTSTPRTPVLFQHPVTAVFNAGLEGSTFITDRDLSQASSLFTVGAIVNAGGRNRLVAPTFDKHFTLAHEVDRARLDGVLAPSEWPELEDIEWHAHFQEGHTRPGRLGMMHDGEFLYIGARIPDPTMNAAVTPDEFRVYLSDNATEPVLLDLITITPQLSGLTRDHKFGEQGDDGCSPNTTWCRDELQDRNKTSARMAYAAQGWTLELARPMNLPGKPREINADNDGWEDALPEDVALTRGNLSGLYVEFVDTDSGERWRFPKAATAEDGERGHLVDSNLTDEAQSWHPFFTASRVHEPPRLLTGPRVVQGASIGGVSVLASLSIFDGHDTYEAFEAAQGFGLATGIGLLADLGGSDTYSSVRWSQGAADASGYAQLFDYDGNDIYRARESSQGHSPQDVAGGGGTEVVPLLFQAARIQPRGSLLDLGGYDHYDYRDRADKMPLVAVRPKSNEVPDVSYDDNDWLWTQGDGGVGFDTYLVQAYQHRLGGDIGVDLGDECVGPVCAQPTAEPEVQLTLGSVHRNVCRERVPYTDDNLPFPRDEGALVVNGTVCVTVQVVLNKDRGLEPERVELLRSGERHIIDQNTQAPGPGTRDGIPVDVYLYELRVNTRELSDGVEDWRVVAYLSPEVPLFSTVRREVVLAQGNQTVVLSNPPIAERIDPRLKAFSPRPAIGSVGLPLDVRVSHDISEDRLELAGYLVGDRNVPCPFAPNDLCNRYPLYIRGNQLVPARPSSPLPSGSGTEEPGWGEPDQNGRPLAGAAPGLRHDLLDDLTLVGGHTLGFVADGDDDHRLALAGTTPFSTFGFVEVNSNHRTAGRDDAFSVGELLVTHDGGNAFEGGEMRLTSFGGSAPTSIVDPLDSDAVLPIEAFGTGADQPMVGYVDVDGDERFGPGDILVADLDGDGVVTQAQDPAGASHANRINAGDVILYDDATGRNGAFVEHGDPLNGAPLRIDGAPNSELSVSGWRFLDLDDDGAIGPGEPVYLDLDGDGNVTEGDLRLGRFHGPQRTAAHLVYYHQPYFQAEATVIAELRTGTLGTTPAGEPEYDEGAWREAAIAAGQDHPLVAYTHGHADVTFTTPGMEPGGGNIEGWSEFWLPFETTRTYPGGPPAKLGGDRFNGLELKVQTRIDDGEGPIAQNCVPVQVIANEPLSCPWDRQTYNVVDCTVSLTARGLCLTTRYADTDITPSRLDLYVPTETSMVVQLNATDEAGLSRLAFTKPLEGDHLQRVKWVPFGGFEDGYYGLNLTAFDVGPKVESGELVVDQRWAPEIPGGRVLLDANAPETEVLLGRYVGTTQIDPITESFKVRWKVDDGAFSSGVDELRIFGAPGSNPALNEYKLVGIVRNINRDGVDFVIDQKEDTYSFVAVAMDQVGNVEGVNQNFWPANKCPEVLPFGMGVWEPGMNKVGFPNLDRHCFGSKEHARTAAFLGGLLSKIGGGERVTTTVDTNVPVIQLASFGHLDGTDLPRLRVGTREVPALAAGGGALVEACVQKLGAKATASNIEQVNFFLLTTLEDGTTIQRKSRLNATTGTCYEFRELGNWTAKQELYPEGLWTAGIEVLDGAGNLAQESFGVIYLDATPPTILEGGVLFPHGQTAIVRGQELTVDVQTEDATEVVFASLAAPRLNATGTVDLKVSRGGVVTGRLLVDRAVPDGEYTAYLNITDALGNTLVETVTIPVDTTTIAFKKVPELTTLDPALGRDGASASTRPDGFGLSFTTSTPSRYRVLAGTNPARLGVVSEYLGNFTTEHEALVAGLASSTLYFVKVEAWSPGGVTASTDVFRLVTGASFIVELTDPRSGEAIGKRPTITWNASMVKGDALPEGSQLAFLVSLRKAPSAPWEVVGGTTGGLGETALDADLSALPNGRTYALRVEAALGRERASAVVEPLTLDKEPPVAVLESPIGGWSNTTTPTVVLALSDQLSGVAREPVRDVRIDGQPAAYSLSEDGKRVEVRPTTGLAPGRHTLVATTADAAGNTAETVVQLVVDLDAPRLQVTSFDGVVTVRPGAPLTIELLGEDDGQLALAEATLGDSVVRQLNPGTRTVLQLPTPQAFSGPKVVTVRLVDAAGNAASSTHPVVVDATPPRLLDNHVRPRLTGATVTIDASEPIRAVARLAGKTFTAGPGSNVALELEGLRPGLHELVPITISDLAGNAVQETILVTTLDDLVDPSAPANVTARTLGNGTIVVAWRAATDNAGIDRYSVERALAGSDGWNELRGVAATQYVDPEATPGVSYHYRITAIDLGSRRGPAATSGAVEAVARPVLTAPGLSPETGTTADDFTFRVHFRQPGGQAPDEVLLVLDGMRVPMERTEGDPAEGIAYQVTIPVPPHGPTGPHEHHFEARTLHPFPQTLRYPVHGELDGPLVTVLGASEDAEGGLVALKETPLAPMLALFTLAGAALFVRRRWSP